MYENIKFVSGGKYVSRQGQPWLHQTRVIDTTELIIVTDGEVNMFIGDERHTAEVGAVLKIPPGVLHGGTAESRGTSFFWIHFHGADDEELPPVYSRPEGYDRAVLIARELLHYAETAGYPRECADAMTRVLLAELSYTSGKSGGALISEIKEWIKREGYTHSAASVAKRYGYNADYLNRIFKERLGIGLKQYIDRRRTELIKRDLTLCGESLAAIADKYGFEDYKCFLKFFKYHAGISPTKYREIYCNLHTN